MDSTPTTTARGPNPPRLLEAANAYWDGLETWAAARGLPIHTDLDTLLSQSPPA